jgi:diamine N-acetyltransferase
MHTILAIGRLITLQLRAIHMISTIRRADIKDVAIVSLIGRLTFRETFSALFVQHEGELRDYLDHIFAPAKIAASLAKHENRYWLASVDGLPVGYAKLKFPSTHPALTAAAPAQLQKIYVLAEFLSQDVGSALMREILAEADRLGVDDLWLNVLSSNRRAIAFYEKQSWEHVAETFFAIGSQSFHFLTLRSQRSP